MCPHYDAYGKRCKVSDTYQDDNHIQNYCSTPSEWGRCANFPR